MLPFTPISSVALGLTYRSPRLVATEAFCQHGLKTCTSHRHCCEGPSHSWKYTWSIMILHGNIKNTYFLLLLQCTPLCLVGATLKPLLKCNICKHKTGQTNKPNNTQKQTQPKPTECCVTTFQVKKRGAGHQMGSRSNRKAFLI